MVLLLVQRSVEGRGSIINVCLEFIEIVVRNNNVRNCGCVQFFPGAGMCK